MKYHSNYHHIAFFILLRSILTQMVNFFLGGHFWEEWQPWFIGLSLFDRVARLLCHSSLIVLTFFSAYTLRVVVQSLWFCLVLPTSVVLSVLHSPFLSGMVSLCSPHLLWCVASDWSCPGQCFPSGLSGSFCCPGVLRPYPSLGSFGRSPYLLLCPGPQHCWCHLVPSAVGDC